MKLKLEYEAQIYWAPTSVRPMIAIFIINVNWLLHLSYYSLTHLLLVPQQDPALASSPLLTMHLRITGVSIFV